MSSSSEIGKYTEPHSYPPSIVMQTQDNVANFPFSVPRRRRRSRTGSLYSEMSSSESSSLEEEEEEDDEDEDVDDNDEEEEYDDGEFRAEMEDGEDDIVMSTMETTVKSKTTRARAYSAPNKSSITTATTKRKRSAVRTKTGAWTDQEDDALRKLVEEHGAQKWSTIARSLPGRIGKQARERWFNHLSPDINKSWWSEEEERFIVEFHDLYGNLWSQLSRMLNNGRPANAVKNHWNSTLKRAVEKGKSVSKSGDTHYFVELPACPTKRETGRGSTKATGTGQYIKIKFRKAGDPIDDRLKIPDDEDVIPNNLSPRSSMSISPRSTRSRATSRASRYSGISSRSSSLDDNVKPIAMEDEETTVPPPRIGQLVDDSLMDEEEDFDEMDAPQQGNVYTVTPHVLQLPKQDSRYQQVIEPGSFSPHVPHLEIQHKQQQQQQQHHSQGIQHQQQQRRRDEKEELILQRQRQAALERMALNYNESISCWNTIARMQPHHSDQRGQYHQEQLFSNDLGSQAMDPLFDVAATTPFSNDHSSFF